MSSKYDQIIKEALGDSLGNEQPVVSPEPSIKIKKVEDIFDVYEEVGMSAEMGLNDLIAATVEDILRQVPQESQVTARIAVKKMWADMIKNWKSFEGYER